MSERIENGVYSILYMAFLKKEKCKMREESPQSSPQENIVELVHVCIQSKLRQVGINLLQVNKDDSVITVITDKEVPKEIKSDICQYAKGKGFTIKFTTSG